MTLAQLDQAIQILKCKHSGNTEVKISVCGEVVGPIKAFEPDTVRGETVLLLNTDFEMVLPDITEPPPPDWSVPKTDKTKLN